MDLSKLIASGYTAMDILESIYKKKPKQLGKIKNLISYGYAPSTILHYLSGDKKNKEDKYMTSEERMFAEDEARRSKFGKLIAGLAGGLGGLAGLVAGQEEEPEGSMMTQQSQAKQNLPVGEKFQDYMSQLPEEKMPQEQEPVEELMQPRARQSSIETNFPELTQTTKKFLEKGMSPEQAYDTLKKSKLYSRLVKEYEEVEGEPYLESIKRKQPKKRDTLDQNRIFQMIQELKKYRE